MFKRSIYILFIIIISITSVDPALAQDSGPVYIVQSGDTYYSIAARFNVGVDELIAANPSVDPNNIDIGQEILIPGLTGMTGRLETEIIAFGDSLRSLSRRTQVNNEHLRKLNRLISPGELYVGISLVLPVQEGQTSLSTRISPATGESLMELAIKQGSDAWTITSLNKINGTWSAIPGDVLYSSVVGNESTTAIGLPSAFLNATISPLPLVQGSTEVIRIETAGDLAVSATLIDKPLNFFPSDSGKVALQGVHALLEPGIYPFRIEAMLPDGSKQSFEQMVIVVAGDYQDEELVVDPVTIDPATTELEYNTVISVVTPSTSAKNWNAVFSSPSIYPDQFTSFFGTRRIYHGRGTTLTAEGIHTGLDFSGGEGLPISAPAPGNVVFAAPLTVRGNATIIDHGWGVYSGFWHQSEIQVNVGDFVEQGQVIGLVGETGRATGAHLHWEVWVNGVQVNPLDWMNQPYP